MSEYNIDGKMFWKISGLCLKIQDDGTLNASSSSISSAGIIGTPIVFLAKNKADAGFVAKVKDGIVIAFRGSDTVADYFTDLDIRQVYLQDYGNVHKGFHDSLLEIGPKMIDKAIDMLSDMSSDKKQLFITGHSKGGAMATLLSCDVVRKVEKVKVITYGSPRVGSSEFARNYKIENYRYESFADAVPHLPFTDNEIKLIARQSSLYHLTDDIFQFLDYVSVGTKIDVFVDHLPYTSLPHQQNNPYGESLNSWCAIEWMFRNIEFVLFNDIHNKDYSSIK